jgi:hypothetical protein
MSSNLAWKNRRLQVQKTAYPIFSIPASIFIHGLKKPIELSIFCDVISPNWTIKEIYIQGVKTRFRTNLIIKTLTNKPSVKFLKKIHAVRTIWRQTKAPRFFYSWKHGTGSSLCCNQMFSPIHIWNLICEFCCWCEKLTLLKKPWC